MNVEPERGEQGNMVLWYIVVHFAYAERIAFTLPGADTPSTEREADADIGRWEGGKGTVTMVTHDK